MKKYVVALLLGTCTLLCCACSELEIMESEPTAVQTPALALVSPQPAVTVPNAPAEPTPDPDVPAAPDPQIEAMKSGGKDELPHTASPTIAFASAASEEHVYDVPEPSASAVPEPAAIQSKPEPVRVSTPTPLPFVIAAPEPPKLPYITAPEPPTYTPVPEQTPLVQTPATTLAPEATAPPVPTPEPTAPPMPTPTPAATPTLEGGYAVCSCGATLLPDELVPHMKQHAIKGESHNYTAY